MLPRGYFVSGTRCGIKKDKLDLGIINIPSGATCVAAFTTNLLKTDSIIVSQEHLSKTKFVKSIIANSGCANTASGPNGYKVTKEICSYLSKKLNISLEEVLIASTGVIGVPLPKQKIISGIEKIVKEIEQNGKDYLSFAKSIMTTDTVPKIVYDKINIDGKIVTTTCFAKGAGMIGPQLVVFNNRMFKMCPSTTHATMLVFFLSDINISKVLLYEILKEDIIPEFNSFSIDADMSPNDTIFLCTNGLAGNKKIVYKDLQYSLFRESVKKVAKQIVQKLLFDGEGVTRGVKLIIRGMDNISSEKIAKTVASSLLVKTAINGADPNWGRILSACCRAGVKLELNKINIYIGKHLVVKNGQNNFVSDKVVRKVMLNKYYEITIDICSGKNFKEYSFYTTDLSKKYVDINSKYKT
ncbi:MAG: bifunctional glutamate N-acetyltransferase/amino-acid acetyltransferase ArgJ [Endomicrobiia bacterium]